MQKLYIPIVLVLLCLTTLQAQVTLTGINVAYEQNFNSLPASGTAIDISTLPEGWTFVETGTNANTTYAASTGSSNAGNTYSFGTDSDRAFGGLLSGSLTPIIGASFVNNTGTMITALNITYRGEQWRLGTTGREPDRIDFQYSTDATTLNSGTWTNVNELDFSGPVVNGTVGLLNGNDPANSATVSFTISGLAISQGQSFLIRWLDFNVSGADDGLAIDNFILTPQGIPSDQPSITFTPSALAFGEINLNQSNILSYEVTGANLTEPIVVSITNPNYTLSEDLVTFSSSVTLPDTGAVVYVKFTPLTGGPKNSEIIHTSGETVVPFTVTGTGFDQSSNIIPIATARTRPVGSKVTVAGRVTVGNELGNPAYLQDATGGIPVFDFNVATSVSIGDSIIVTGPIGVFNSQVQISGSGIIYTAVNVPPVIPTPKPISITQLAANEGLLVTVQDVELVNKDLIFYPQSTERITNGSTQADLRIDGSTNIPGLAKPQGVTDITGVVGRFGSNAQLLPRFEQDIPGATEPSVPSDSISKDLTFDVVNWNLEFFGGEEKDADDEFGPADEALQLQNVKTVLLSLDADIIAVQEVSSDSLLGVLVSQLPGYKYTCSARYSYSFQGPDDEFPPQKVCYIYDTTTVSLISERPLFEALYDAARTTNPSLIPGYPTGDPSSFYSSGRLAYLFTADVTIDGVTERISFINIHAKSGSAANDRNRRLYDATALKDSLDANFPSEKFIILGDLNDDLDQSITTGQPTPYAAFVNDTERYIPVTKALSDIGARSTTGFTDVIDHQILSNELQEEYIAGSTQIITPFRLIPDYANTTSDHLPVTSRFAFQAAVASFTQSAVSLNETSSAQTVTINLNRPVAAGAQLIAELSGNASYGEDFTTTPSAENGTLTINLAEGNTSATFTFTVINDGLDELTETVTFSLQASSGIKIGEASQFTASIADNDIPTIAFVEQYAEADEGSGAYSVKLSLSTPPATAQSATIEFYSFPWTTYGSDYTTQPGMSQNKVVVNIPAGSEVAQFSLIPLADNKKELPLEIISFVLAETTPGLKPVSPRISLFSINDVKPRRGNLIAFPNPTRGKISLSGDGFDGDDQVFIELNNENGSVVLRRNGSLDHMNDVLGNFMQHQRRGVYTLKVSSDGEIFLIRIVKN